MAVCPVCEHAQVGGPECEVCGRRLDEVPEDESSAQVLEGLDGLESTLQPSVPDPPPESIPDLEPTGRAPAPAPNEPLLLDMEVTGAAPVDPPVDPMLGVERISDGAAVEEPTPYPAVVLCRYCRTEAALGAKLCERCGMRLPTAELPAPEPDQALRLCSCGTPIRGSLCPSCGARTSVELP